MTKVSININKATLAIMRLFEDLKNEQQTMEEIGDFVVKRIVADARLSKRMTEVGKKSLPKLSKSYQAFRKGQVYFYQKDGKLLKVPGKSYKLENTDEFFNANAKISNLTFTGQLIKSLTYEIKNNKILIFFPETSRSDTSITNAKVFEYLLDLNEGYDVLNLDKDGQKRVKKIFVDLLRKEIKARFK